MAAASVAASSSLTYSSSLRRQARGKVETLVMRRRQSSATNFSWHSSSVVLVLDTKQNYSSSREPFKNPEINRFEGKTKVKISELVISQSDEEMTKTARSRRWTNKRDY